MFCEPSEGAKQTRSIARVKQSGRTEARFKIEKPIGPKRLDYRVRD